MFGGFGGEPVEEGGTMSADMVIRSTRFYDMHELEVVYERRDFSEVMPIDRMLLGFKHLDMRVLLHDRPAEALGKGIGGELVPGQIVAPIKFLKRLSDGGGEEGELSPVFFFCFKNYDHKLLVRRAEMNAIGEATWNSEEFRVRDILEVALGGLFVVKKMEEDKTTFHRARVVKIDLSTEAVYYWAVDDAFYDKCQVADLHQPDKVVSTMPMLAVPGIFEAEPTPTQLAKFEAPAKAYCLAKIRFPRYLHEFSPRKITLL